MIRLLLRNQKPVPLILAIYDKGTFRSGGISSIFFKKGDGLTLGRNMFIGERDDSDTEDHESIHLDEQLNAFPNLSNGGWAGFYGKLILGYIKYSFGKGPLEDKAYGHDHGRYSW